MIQVYKVTWRFPKKEKFGMMSEEGCKFCYS